MLERNLIAVMASTIEHAYHLLTVHLLLLILSSSPLAAKVTNSTDLSALLSFKSQISGDPLGALSSWNESIHHCQWQGVLCGQHHPNRVSALVLGSKQLSGYISPSLANLTFLQRIDLSNNHLEGSIPVELGYLTRLRFFNLSMNFLNGSLPSTLGNCSKLQVISFANNYLHGIVPSSIARCKELKVFNLTDNNFIGSIPPELGLLPQLYFFAIGRNNLTGSIPLTFGNLTKLSFLYLHENNLDGHIPSVLGNLTNLLDLRLHQNGLSGVIPSSLGNLNSVEVLYLGDNNISGLIPKELGKLQNLKLLGLYDSDISGEIPRSVYNISSLVELGLGTNMLTGTLPLDMCDSFPNLQYLRAYENYLSGQIPQTISKCVALYDIDLGENLFSGIIPSTLGALQNLQYLTLSGNQLEADSARDWGFIDALTNCTFLQFLDLGYNRLQGVLPNSISNFSSINILRMSNNSVKGSIPTELRKLTNLEYLLLDNMLLGGTISQEIGNLYRLGWLDLSNNLFSGQIPLTFGNLTQMIKLQLDKNAFEGTIPPELVNMQSLELLDLSNNKLTGKIPKEIMSLTSLSIRLDLSNNNLTNVLPPEIGNLNNLQSISLSNNKLFGNLPNTIGGCKELQALYLENNLFQGIIPSTMDNLGGLEKLDISNNAFSGQIPEFIGKMNMQYLNISFNNFEGELPTEGIFRNISGLDVRGNPKLCGGISEIHLQPCITESPKQSHQSLRNIKLICAIVGSFICLIIIVWLLVNCYYRSKPHSNQQFAETIKFDLRHVSYNDLLRATQNFSPENLIGRGTYGTVYKAIINFENMPIVAVKVLNLEVHGAFRSFFSECEALRNVRHRNLIKVLSSCSGINHQGNDFKALVFEFMPNGSLEGWLHPNTNQPFRSLSLIQRLSIAIDVALALEYLHFHGPTPIVHCDLKPGNILLDNDMTAHVGDFGLARFLIHPDTILSQSMTSSGGIRGSIGYIPPEYGMGGQPSAEGDVYSYGILLLEMFTGISPTDETIRDGLSLHKQVEMAFPEQIMNIADKKLYSEMIGDNNPFALENIYNCLISVIKCGLLCSKESPKERISVKNVVEELNSSRRKLLGP